MKRTSFPVDDAGTLVCDVDTLVDTRLLVQANSGGGKSFAVRYLLEQTHGRVQHLVLDAEGEFATLRERFDYVHAAAAGGDTVAHPRSAALLAERLLELGVSAVLDLYELQAHDRVRFVRLFLEALVNAPKRLWHPVLVVVDEAHVFCPEKGQAESAGAVIDLCSRGRKRGFCAVLATQRLAKLNKDAAAELNNKLIGRCSLDIDLQRAADELGFPKSRWQELRELPAGHFFATGPAFSARGVTPVHVGKVVTTHPKAGARIAFTAPPATSKIRALLPKLADLPAEAEERARTVEEMCADVKRLERELAAAKKGQPAAPAPQPPPKVERVEVRVEVPVLTAADRDEVRACLAELGRIRALFAAPVEALERKLVEAMARAQPGTVGALRHASIVYEQRAPGAPVPPRPMTPRTAPAAAPTDAPRLGSGERTVLIAIAQHGAGVTREQLTVLTGYKRSTRDAYIQRLAAARLVEVETFAGVIVVLDAGIAALGSDYKMLPTGDALREYWLAEGRLPEGERAVLDVVVNAYPGGVPRDDVTEITGYKRSTRDAYVQRLAARKLVTVERGGAVRASDMLFDRRAR